MSYMVDVHVHPAIVAGAVALDNLMACIKHKVAPDAKKHKLLAVQTKVYADRLNAIVAGQSDEPNTFTAACYKHLERIQGERAEIAERARQQREARELAQSMGMVFA